MHTCHKHLFAGAALADLVWPAGCAAQMMLSAAAASQIIEGCAVHAKAKGQSHAIAVYDAGGIPLPFFEWTATHLASPNLPWKKPRL